MGTKYVLSVLGTLWLIMPTAPPMAAISCDTATTSSMANPPNPRVLSVFVPDRPRQWMMVSVVAKGAKNPTVQDVQMGSVPMLRKPTRGESSPHGVRVFHRPNPQAGEDTLTITYSDQPEVDAVLVSVCSGLRAGGAGDPSMTPTEDHREVLRLSDEDGVEDEMRIIGGDGQAAELQVEAPGLWLKSLGSVRP